MCGRGQAPNIVVDVSLQNGATQAIAERGIIRAYGVDDATGSPKIQNIRVVGSHFDILVPRRNNYATTTDQTRKR